MSFIVNFKKKISQEYNLFLGLPAILWQIIFLWVPLAFVFFYSFISAKNGAFKISINSYFKVIDIAHLRVILNSLILAIYNAFSCLIIAYPLAYAIVFRVKKLKNLALFLMVLPFWVNFLVHIYAWFFVLEYHGIINNILIWLNLINEPLRLMNSWFAIMVVMVYAYLPFIVLPIYSAMEKLDVKLIEASSDLGASLITTFFKIIIPITFKGARLGFFLVFVMSFGEFVIPTLVGGGKSMFVGTLIWQYFLTDQNISLGAAFTVLSGIIMVIFLAVLAKLSNMLISYNLQNKK